MQRPPESAIEQLKHPERDLEEVLGGGDRIIIGWVWRDDDAVVFHCDPVYLPTLMNLASAEGVSLDLGQNCQSHIVGFLRGINFLDSFTITHEQWEDHRDLFDRFSLLKLDACCAVVDIHEFTRLSPYEQMATILKLRRWLGKACALANHLFGGYELLYGGLQDLPEVQQKLEGVAAEDENYPSTDLHLNSTGDGFLIFTDELNPRFIGLISLFAAIHRKAQSTDPDTPAVRLSLACGEFFRYFSENSFNAIGSAVNQAFRINSQTRPNQILIEREALRKFEEMYAGTGTDPRVPDLERFCAELEAQEPMWLTVTDKHGFRHEVANYSDRLALFGDPPVEIGVERTEHYDIQSFDFK